MTSTESALCPSARGVNIARVRCHSRKNSTAARTSQPQELHNHKNSAADKIRNQEFDILEFRNHGTCATARIVQARSKRFVLLETARRAIYNRSQNHQTSRVNAGTEKGFGERAHNTCVETRVETAYLQALAAVCAVIGVLQASRNGDRVGLGTAGRPGLRHGALYGRLDVWMDLMVTIQGVRPMCFSPGA